MPRKRLQPIARRRKRFIDHLKINDVVALNSIMFGIFLLMRKNKYSINWEDSGYSVGAIRFINSQAQSLNLGEYEILIRSIIRKQTNPFPEKQIEELFSFLKNNRKSKFSKFVGEK